MSFYLCYAELIVFAASLDGNIWMITKEPQVFILVGGVLCVLNRIEGWNYINLHCRDNENAPVDWWIMYKPPSGEGRQWETGRNFTYITSDNSGKWQPSDRYITSNSMLQQTLSPLFRPTYADHLAMLAYQSKKKAGAHAGSSAQGIMLADEMGGIWLRHTVPGLPDLTQDRVIFPIDEIPNGHMIICFSLDLVTLNSIARSLNEVDPEVLRLQVPVAVKQWLPYWLSKNSPNMTGKKSLKKLEFGTQAQSLRAYLIVRPPGDKRCLYKTFAQTKRIVLDVYGHDKRAKTVCEKSFSVRHVDAISLKYPEDIYYINKKSDRIGFAVSTAAAWQRSGDAKNQYWTCTGTTEAEDSSGKGGLIVCVEDYSVWRSFDTLKVKEPEC